MVRLSYCRRPFRRDHLARDLALSPLTLSYGDVEELMAERGLDVSYETVRRWVLKFGLLIAVFQLAGTAVAL